MKQRAFILLALILTVCTVEVSSQSFLKKLKKSVEKEVQKIEQEVTNLLNNEEDEPQPQQQQSQQPRQQSQSQRRSIQSHDVQAIDVMIPYGPTSGTVNGHKWVDMGLPSGTRWATCNIDATKEEQPGKLYAWGEIATKTAYTQANCKYYAKTMTDFSGNKTYDVATAKWGNGWRMPTEEEFAELLFYCDWEYVQIGGRWGSKITSPKTNNSIFLPATGYKEETSHRNVSGNGMYWTSTPHTSQWNNGAYMYQFGGALGEVSIGERSYGYAIRAVTSYDIDTDIPSSGEINGHKYVDLGLPSGLKWATCNVGTNAVDQDGNYFAWGDIPTYSEKSPDKNKLDGVKTDDISGNAKYDVARASWGGTWRLPTEEEFYELIDNCTFEWTTLGRRNGLKVTSKINGNYIFLPASGNFPSRIDSYGRAYKLNETASYWTSTPAIDDYSYDAYTFVMSEKRYIILKSARFQGNSIRPVSD